MFGLRLVPIYGVGMRIEDFVVEHLRAGDGLFEIPVQIFAGDFFDSLDEVFASRVGEAIAHEIRVQCLPQCFFADDFLEGEKYRGSLAVGDGGIGAVVVKSQAKRADRVIIRMSRDTLDAAHHLRPSERTEIENRSVLP